jgi:hypothetical protein
VILSGRGLIFKPFDSPLPALAVVRANAAKGSMRLYRKRQRTAKVDTGRRINRPDLPALHAAKSGRYIFDTA